MKKSTFGTYEFEPGESDVAFDFMWDCLMDLSFMGRVEVVLRILFKRRPRPMINKENFLSSMTVINTQANRQNQMFFWMAAFLDKKNLTEEFLNYIPTESKYMIEEETKEN